MINLFSTFSEYFARSIFRISLIGASLLATAACSAVLQAPRHIAASDGVLLAYYDFVPEHPKAVMVFYHGIGSWSSARYQDMARDFAENHNIGVYLFDIRGHGNSQGPRGDAPSREQVWRDVYYAIDFVHHLHESTPLLVGGHAVGAGLALAGNTKFPHDAVSGYVLLAPWLDSQSLWVNLAPPAVVTKYMFNERVRTELREKMVKACEKNRAAGRYYDDNDSDTRKSFIKSSSVARIFAYFASNGAFCGHSPLVRLQHLASREPADRLLLNYYTGVMLTSFFPDSGSEKLFADLDKPCILFIGERDEHFVAEKVVKYHECLTQVKERSVSAIIPGATHLSLLAAVPARIAQALGVMGLIS